MQKYDNMVLLFAGSVGEFREYIKMLVQKDWIVRFDFPSNHIAIIGTSKNKVVVIKYISKVDDLLGVKMSDVRNEVITTGTWYKKKWINDTLQRLHGEYKNLRFKSAYINTKP